MESMVFCSDWIGCFHVCHLFVCNSKLLNGDTSELCLYDLQFFYIARKMHLHIYYCRQICMHMDLAIKWYRSFYFFLFEFSSLMCCVRFVLLFSSRYDIVLRYNGFIEMIRFAFNETAIVIRSPHAHIENGIVALSRAYSCSHSLFLYLFHSSFQFH